MTYPANLPNPTVAYPEFIAALVEMEDVSNLSHFRAAAGKKEKLWVISVAEHVAEGLIDEIIEVGMVTIQGDERINTYIPTPGAKEWWHNGKESKLSHEEILASWRAMQSILKDGKEE